MQEQKQNRKGQAGMGNLLMSFVLVAAVLILIVLIIFIFGILATSFENTKIAQTSINDTGFINSTGFQLANGIGGNPRDFSVSIARNTTAIIFAGNYTVSSTGLVTNKTTSTVPGTWQNINFTYTYNNDSSEISASYAAQNSTNDSIALIGVLLIVLATSSIITVLIISLMGRRRA